MNGKSFILSNEIVWSITELDPIFFDLPSFDGLSLVNPLYYKQILSKMDSNVRVISLYENACIMSSKCLIFCENTESVPSLTEETAVAKILQLLKKWRHVSKQPLLNSSIGAIMLSHQVEIKELKQIIFPDKSVLPKTRVSSRYVEGALTCSMVQAHRDITEYTHDTILLDAIAAFHSSNFRMAILYSAISMDAAARTCLNIAYETAKVEKADRHRLVEVTSKEGPVTKDPIYEALCSGTSFKKLLHERPLYLLGHSMQIDNKELYDKALALYKTRNQIAHTGDTSGNIEFDREGAQSAIRTAIQTLAWFKIGEGYSVPEFKFLPCRGLCGYSFLTSEAPKDITELESK